MDHQPISLFTEYQSSIKCNIFSRQIVLPLLGQGLITDHGVDRIQPQAKAKEVGPTLE